MKHDINYDYKYEYDKSGSPYLPEEVFYNSEDLLVFPDGKLLEPGVYTDRTNGDCIIYEPFELSIASELLQNNIIEDNSD